MWLTKRGELLEEQGHLEDASGDYTLSSVHHMRYTCGISYGVQYFIYHNVS